MLCYVILCIAIYFAVVKYWFKKKKPIEKVEVQKSTSILDELEIETNIFEISPEEKKEISKFEIESPYQEKSTEEFLDIKQDEIINDEIKRLMDD